MCSGTKRRPPAMEAEKAEGGGPQRRRFSELLEHAASDDLAAFRAAAEEEEEAGRDVNEQSLWYGRRIGSKRMSFEERTPAMIAAMFGSKAVLGYLIGTARADVNAASASDGATALHCAAAGGSPAAAEIVELLLAASADAGAVDAAGKRAAEVASMSMSPRPRAASAKREYPGDATLPDIKNGVYGTDEFRMYAFKVKPCSRAYSHDWTECPFVHPGENARRRDPRRYHYSCVPCPEFRKGACRHGDACDYAHGIFECWLHPAQYRTRLCKDESSCQRRVCFFAHHPRELRPLHASTGSALSFPTFARRSLSFVERRGLMSPPPSPMASPGLFGDWGGSPGWGVDLGKLRKSASFGIRSSGNVGNYTAALAEEDEEEPDVSWVQSLVLDTQPAWMEQEQLVA